MLIIHLAKYIEHTSARFVKQHLKQSSILYKFKYIISKDVFANKTQATDISASYVSKDKEKCVFNRSNITEENDILCEITRYNIDVKTHIVITVFSHRHL